MSRYSGPAAGRVLAVYGADFRKDNGPAIRKVCPGSFIVVCGTVRRSTVEHAFRHQLVRRELDAAFEDTPGGVRSPRRCLTRAASAADGQGR